MNMDLITMVINELPVLQLDYWDYNCSGTLDVYASDLRNAEVGDVLEPEHNSNCGRGIHREWLTVVYKDSRGVAAVLACEGTTDSPSPEEWAKEDQLIWFRLR